MARESGSANVSIYFAPGREAALLDEFDELVVGEDTKRSAKLRDAMALYLEVEEILEEHELGMSEDAKRRWVRSVLTSDLANDDG